jgi:hypothetical protein
MHNKLSGERFSSPERLSPSDPLQPACLARPTEPYHTLEALKIRDTVGVKATLSESRICLIRGCNATLDAYRSQQMLGANE